MDKALAFLKHHYELAFATVENGKPKLRVFQIMKQQGEELYFATAPHKEVYKQLQANPYVELLAMTKGVSVRIEGQAYFDVEDELAQEIYTTNPVLPRLYAHYTDLVYFRIPIRKLDYFDLNYNPPLFESYSR